MRHVEIVNAGLNDDFAKLNLTTGEIIKEDKEKPIRITVKQKGFNYEMVIRKLTLGRATDHYLLILLNTKMLKEKYFEGLTQTNIRDIYDAIMGLGLVKFSWEDFLLKSNCTDIDVCMDYELDRSSFNKHLQSLMEITPFSRERDQGYKPYDNGVEWNNRKTATNSNPFLKIYDKERELWSQSNIFTEGYLKDEDIANRKRIEFTFKDANHLKYLKVTDSSLVSILNITQIDRMQMMKKIMHKVFDINQMIDEVQDSEEKPDRTVLVRAMRYMYSNGLGKEAATKFLITDLNTSNKSKYRKKLKELWQSKVEVTCNDGGKDFLTLFNLI